MSIKLFISYIRLFLKINFFKTIYFNFKKLRFKDACRFPCLFFGNVEFGHLSGEVRFTVPIKFGLFRYGVESDGYAPSRMPSKFSLGRNSVLEINGRSDIGYGSVFRICEHIILSNNSFIGSNSAVGCDKEIYLGKLAVF